MYVGALLQQKGHEVVSVYPRESVSDVAALLSRRGVGAVLAEDSSGHAIGIISERCIVRGIASSGAKCLSMSAEELMTTGVIVKDGWACWTWDEPDDLRRCSRVFRAPWGAR